MYGDKIYKPYRPLFPTPDDIPLETTCVTISIPYNPAWIGLWIAALLVLTNEENFVQFDGGISRETTAEIFREALFDALTSETITCELSEPYWDDAEGDDAANGESNPEFPFYEDVAQFAIAGFVLYATGSPTTALQFWTVAQQFRIAYRKQNLGGIIKIFMDAVQIGEVDTYSASPELGFFDVGSTGSTLRLEFPTVGTVTQVLRKRLWEQEIIGDTIRYYDGEWQTYDPYAGEWIDNPLADPRTLAMWRLPAGGGSDIKCESAANLRAKFEAMINAFLLATSIIDACNAIVGIVLVFFPPARLLWVIIIAIVEALYAIGVATINAAFNFGAYDELQCIIFDEIGSDGQITDAIKDAIYARIEDEMTFVQFAVLSLLITALGTVGMNNAAQLRDEAADCDSCPQNWRYKWDFHINNGGFTFDPEAGNTGGTWVGGIGNGYQKGYSGIVCAQYDVSRKSADFTVGATTHITEMTVVLDPQGSDQCSHLECYIGSSRANGFTQNMYIYQSTNGSSETDTGDITNVGTVHLTFQSGNSDGTGDFYSVELAGTGIPPNFTGGAFI